MKQKCVYWKKFPIDNALDCWEFIERYKPKMAKKIINIEVNSWNGECKVTWLIEGENCEKI